MNRIASVLHNSRGAINRKSAIGANGIKNKFFNVMGFVIILPVLRVTDDKIYYERKKYKNKSY